MKSLRDSKFLQTALNILRFLIFTNIFISVCSVVMSCYTYGFFSLTPNYILLTFIVSGTLCSYSFHWLLPSSHLNLSPRETWSAANRPLLMVLAILGLAGAAYTFLRLQMYSSFLLPILILTFLYSSGKIPFGPFRCIRKYFVGKTIYLAGVWTLVTVYLPLVTSPGKWDHAYTYFMINRFFLLFAICILFDLRDRDADASEGIRSLITWLSGPVIKYLFFTSLLVSVIAGLFLYASPSSIGNIFILLIPSVITGLSYNYSTGTRSELWFYFYLDGLMMLSGICLLLYSFLFL